MSYFQKLPLVIAPSTSGSYVGGCGTLSDCPVGVALSPFVLHTLVAVGAHLNLSIPPKVLECLSMTGRSFYIGNGRVSGSSWLASATEWRGFLSERVTLLSVLIGR